MLDYAKELKVKHDYDHVWCVIDVEGYGERTNKINGVLRGAMDVGIHIALSNPCFEFWYLCHFEQYGKSLAKCTNVITQLNKIIKKLTNKKKKYKKGDCEIYDNYLRQNLDTAIDNAKHNMNTQFQDGEDWTKKNPSTEVYKIVELLLELANLNN